MMLTKEKRNYLKNIYFNSKHPAAYGGINRMWKSIRLDGVVTRAELKRWLLEQDTYTSFRPFTRKFLRPKTISPYTDAIWGTDVGWMVRYEQHNNGYAYFAVFIDLFSRYLWAYPLKSLRGKEMVDTLKLLFAKHKPEKLFSDQGSEYKNKQVQSYLKSENVTYYYSYNEKKVAHAERVIKQIKSKLVKYMSENNTFKWTDVLDDFVTGYNNAYHRSIKMTPTQARAADQYTVWNNQRYQEPVIKTKSKPSPAPSYKLKIGDSVKLLADKKPFDREYDDKFTTEVFTIIDRKMQQGIPTYAVKDELNETIIGRFYEKELQKVFVAEDKTYKVEKILKKRKRKGKTEYFVKWRGYPSKFSSWVTDVEYIY